MKRQFELMRRRFIRLYRNLIIIPFDKDNKIKWNSIQGKFCGQRAFMIGNGPSLNHTPLWLLKDEHVMCFNRFCLMGERLNFSPDMYMNVDDVVIVDNINEITEQIGKSKYAFMPNIIIGTNVYNLKKLFENNKKVIWMYQSVKKFNRTRLNKMMARKGPWVIIGQTVATTGLEILMKMGFSEIYILGVDMNYVIHKDVEALDKHTHIKSKADDDPNHFDPRYFGKGKEYHQPVQETMDSMMGALKDISEFAKENGYKIYNAGIGGMVECFQRVNIYDLLKDKNQDEVFANLLMEKANIKMKDIDFEKTIDVNVFRGNTSFSVIKESEIERFIKEYINDYLPLGPYKGKYVVVKRKCIV